VRHAAGADHGDVGRRAGRDRLVPVREQALADLVGVDVRDLAPEELDAEARHRAGSYCRAGTRAAGPAPASPSGGRRVPIRDATCAGGTRLRRKRAESATFEQVGGPALTLAPLEPAEARRRRLVGGEVAGGHEPRDVEPRGEGEHRLEGDVREREVGRRQRLGQRVGAPHVDGRVAEPGRRDREDAGAAADVEHAPARQAEQELEAESRRRVRARPERPAGVDDDRNRAAGRALPRRPHPERPDSHGAVERPPALLPARLDLAHARLREGRQHPLRRLAVGGQLDPAAAEVDLLGPLGRELEHARPRRLELGARHADGGADQRNALFSLPRKPSSGPYVPSSESRSNSSSSRRCSSVSRRGTVTLTSTRWSPRPNPCRTGIPRPFSTRTSPGCVPGASSSSTSPSSVSTGTVAPSAACTIVRSTWEKTSLPSRTKRSSGRTRTSTQRSPERPPSAPAWPSPESRIRWPSWMPAGISTSSVRSSSVRPAPPQVSPGCSTTRPEPPHCGQADVRTNSPKTERATCRRRPEPPQRGQAETLVPGRTPLPPQVRHWTATSSGTFAVVPRAASTSSIVTSAATSPPRVPPVRTAPPKRSSPKNALKRSPMSPRSKWRGVKPPERRPAWP